MSKNESAERDNRLAKLELIKESGIHPYPAKFDKKHSTTEIKTKEKDEKVITAGRLIRKRKMGKLTFAHLQDFDGSVQVIFQRDILGEDNYQLFHKIIDLGDFIGVDGEIYFTNTGELSVMVKSWTFLGKALAQMPEKFHGVKDQEILYRRRYLDLISNEETRARFKFRSDFIKAIREFYWQEGFLEVETPTLLHAATGANARPYHTHNNALDIDVVLRISHELPLKELIVGGFEKVFELGKAFRNEGHDISHLPEHTHLEHYAAYWNFEDNIVFTEKMIDYLFDHLKLPRKITIRNRQGTDSEIDFTTPFKRENYIGLLCKDSGLDIMSYTDADKLRADLKAKNIEFENMDNMALGTLIDNLYKKVTRPKLTNPVILYGYPKILQPLARTNDENHDLVDQFQLVVNGWEVIKAYSELVDPLDQRARFEEQAEAKDAGDDEAMEVDEEYLVAMEHGMPPISGWGMGIDRLLTLLTNRENLRDLVLFPLMRS